MRDGADRQAHRGALDRRKGRWCPAGGSSAGGQQRLQHPRWQHHHLSEGEIEHIGHGDLRAAHQRMPRPDEDPSRQRRQRHHRFEVVRTRDHRVLGDAEVDRPRAHRPRDRRRIRHDEPQTDVGARYAEEARRLRADRIDHIRAERRGDLRRREPPRLIHLTLEFLRAAQHLLGVLHENASEVGELVAETAAVEERRAHP